MLLHDGGRSSGQLFNRVKLNQVILIFAKYWIQIESNKFMFVWTFPSSTNLIGVWHFASWVINRSFSAPDSDSEEHNSARGGWPPLSGTRSHGNLARKRRSASSPTSLLSSQKSQKKKHKHLSLLLEEAGLSSSDDSFDQGYWPNLTAPRPSLLSQTQVCPWALSQLVSLFAFRCGSCFQTVL